MKLNLVISPYFKMLFRGIIILIKKEKYRRETSSKKTKKASNNFIIHFKPFYIGLNENKKGFIKIWSKNWTQMALLRYLDKISVPNSTILLGK